MRCFDEDFLTFFRELAGNNHKEWFHANKLRYERKVKDPFYAFVGEMIERIHREDPRVHPEVKNSVFRINRDIRFSKDKSPYKLHVAAAISPGGRRNTMCEPGNYFHLSADSVMVCGGLFRPDKESLLKVRRHLVKHPGSLRGIIATVGFRSKWGEIRRERNKVLPKEFKGAAEKNPLLYNKAFYVQAELPPETVLRPDLAALLMRYFRSARPLNDYLRQARA